MQTADNGAELLAPAGDLDTALAALSAGADAVYCGLGSFSARAFAKNFTLEELRTLVNFAHHVTAEHPAPRRVYVTFNTLIEEAEIPAALERLAELADLRPDALIVQDLGLAALCRRHFPELELHASTQLVAHNLEGVLALKELGFRRVVLARELSLAEIVAIAERCGSRKLTADGRRELELEVFIHGALCYSLSGLCLFGAMEQGRSGNRGACPYCCRQAVTTGQGTHYPFSMKDLRLDREVLRLIEAGVASLKIEGRMKSPLYVASTVAYYRQLLGGGAKTPPVTLADLETVFSRRTTRLYFDGATAPSPIDERSLGHLGAEIGIIKRITRDREGRRFLRFHTARALERHDGLQFEAMIGDRHLGLGIGEMRLAISRTNVCEAAAGSDVEIALDDGEDPTRWDALKSGMRIYASMSNAVKRRFPVPALRKSEIVGGWELEMEVELAEGRIAARASTPDFTADAEVAGTFGEARQSERTFAAVEKALGRLGGTDYRLGRLKLIDPARRFVPPSALNDLRRTLVERLDAARLARRTRRLADAQAAWEAGLRTAAGSETAMPRRTLKLRPDQTPPGGEWDEIVLAVSPEEPPPANTPLDTRLALPLYTSELELGGLRNFVKRCLRAGFAKWECADLATLRLLRGLGVTDLTADWSLYAANSAALATLTALGVRRVVASPESSRTNLAALIRASTAVAALKQQSTPLFLSLTAPGKPPDDLRVWRHGRLYVTTRPAPRTFTPPPEAAVRYDLAWDSKQS